MAYPSSAKRPAARFIGLATAFVPSQPVRIHQPFATNRLQNKSRPKRFRTTPVRHVTALTTEPGRSSTPTTGAGSLDGLSKQEQSQLLPLPPPEQASPRMFSNIEPTSDGSLKRTPPSEIACTALVAGTMIGCGILALPSVAAPSGFVPSSVALLGVWVYMATTGLLISEVTTNTACSLGRASGVSMLSLGTLTLGRAGTLITTASYLLLHYAILTAYIAKGGYLFAHLLESLPIPFTPTLPQVNGLNGLLFSAGLGGTMYLASADTVERFNVTLVVGVVASFIGILISGGTHIDVSSLLQMHWDFVTKGELIPVLFVSCVYQNVISTVTMRLEGDRGKIRRAVIIGSGIPIAMFLAFDAVMMGSGNGMLPPGAHVFVEVFSLLAVATSFIGFVEALTELCADARQTVGLHLQDRWPDFAFTLIPPILFAASSPDVFLKALDVAGTYGIATLFGVLPAAMAWRNRDAVSTKGFHRLVGGGNALLAVIAALPLTLIGSRLWGLVSSSLPLPEVIDITKVAQF